LRLSARRIANQCRRWPSSTGSASKTIYTWRKRFGGFQADDVRRLKQLESENARLKKLVAERDLEIEVMKEVAAKNW
jgi:putative transposase